MLREIRGVGIMERGGGKFNGGGKLVYHALQKYLVYFAKCPLKLTFIHLT